MWQHLSTAQEWTHFTILKARPVSLGYTRRHTYATPTSTVASFYILRTPLFIILSASRTSSRDDYSPTWVWCRISREFRDLRRFWRHRCNEPRAKYQIYGMTITLLLAYELERLKIRVWGGVNDIQASYYFGNARAWLMNEAFHFTLSHVESLLQK